MRKSIKRKAQVAMVVIVDGQTEKWYVEKIKEHYPSATLRCANVKPDLAPKKKVAELFTYARSKYDEEFRNIILVLDMDNILKDNSEFERFKVYYEHYLLAQTDQLSARQKPVYGWMKNLTLIVNTPCLEFWYLLHFGKTNRFFADFDAMESTLKQKNALADYDKSERYYKNSPDIYVRLGGLDGVSAARQNAESFDLDEAHIKGVSEMNKLFDLVDFLDKEA